MHKYFLSSLIIIWLCICLLILFFHQRNHINRLEKIIEDYNYQRSLIYKGELKWVK
jgi:uncharacterized membrane protein